MNSILYSDGTEVRYYENPHNHRHIKKTPDGSTVTYYDNDNNKMHTKHLSDGTEYEYDDTGVSVGNSDERSEDHGKLVKEKKANGEYALIEYWDNTANVKNKNVFDANNQLIATDVHNSNGVINQTIHVNGDIETYHASGRKESLTLSQPDALGNTYYHYKDEDGEGHGKIDKKISATVDIDGAKAYSYGTIPVLTLSKKGRGFGFSVVKKGEIDIQYSYANEDFTGLVAAYELDAAGTYTRKFERRQGSRVVRLPTYISRPVQAARQVVPCSTYLGRSETADKIELRGAMQTQLPAGITQSSILASQPKTISLKLR